MRHIFFKQWPHKTEELGLGLDLDLLDLFTAILTVYYTIMYSVTSKNPETTVL